MLASKMLLRPMLWLWASAAVLVAAASLSKHWHPAIVPTLIGGGALLWLLLRDGAAWLNSPRSFAVVLVLAIILRLAALPLIEGGAIAADPMNYTNLARSLLDGRGLVTADWQYGEGLRAHFPPLYPLLLAANWGVLGESAGSTAFLSLLFDCIAAVTLARIGMQLGHGAAGKLAAMLYLLYPPIAAGAVIPHKEGLTIALALLVIHAMLRWHNDPLRGRLPRHAARLGLFWGLLGLTQPSLLLLAPLTGIAMLSSRGLRAVLGFGLAAGLCAMLVMSPWWIRNWLVFGQFVPFTTAAGYLVNVQLGPNALPFPEGLFALPEPDRGPVMGAQAFGWIAAHPADHARWLAEAVARVFAYEYAVVDSYRHMDPPLAQGTANWLIASFQWLWAALLATAAWGARQLRNSPPDRLFTALFLVIIAGLVSTNIWFEFAERHRYVLTPLLMLLAARGVLGAAPTPRQSSQT